MQITQTSNYVWLCVHMPLCCIEEECGVLGNQHTTLLSGFRGMSKMHSIHYGPWEVHQKMEGPWSLCTHRRRNRLRNISWGPLVASVGQGRAVASCHGAAAGPGPCMPPPPPRVLRDSGAGAMAPKAPNLFFFACSVEGGTTCLVVVLLSLEGVLCLWSLFCSLCTAQ